MYAGGIIFGSNRGENMAKPLISYKTIKANKSLSEFMDEEEDD